MDKAQRRKFEDNYRKYKDKIYTFFMYRTGFNQAISEDLTAETFVKAIRAYARFDESAGSFQAWIYVIAKNHLTNYYKTMGRETGIESLDSGGELSSDDFESAVLARLEWEKAVSLIATLSAYQREVLTLRYVDGMDNREIAHFLQKDEGAVRTQISRARKEFIKNYKDKYEKK